MSARDAARYVGSRTATLGLYTLAIVEVTGWDRDPNSWALITVRLLMSATFLWWAVSRTIRHEREDQKLFQKDPK